MNGDLSRPIFFPFPVLLGWATILHPHVKAQGRPRPSATGLSKEFASQTAAVNGTSLHYVRGGEGPAVILIHGFPEDWSAYRAIMPRLAKRFTVIALDLRDVGGSTATAGGYDAEKLVAGRQADYFGYFFNYGKFMPGEAAQFAMAYAAPAQLRAAFEMYRAFPAAAQFNTAQREPNDVPLFIAAGDGSPFAKLVPEMAKGLRANGCVDAQTGLIAASLHYVVQDQPEAVADLIERHASAGLQ